tara:strand:+ start:458 stop:664 length:207 start_codon:yes stop_codon:yes gene_type:complete
MRFKSQISLKRLTSKKEAKPNTKPNVITILLLLVTLLQIPISLKATLEVISVFSEKAWSNEVLPLFDD